MTRRAANGRSSIDSKPRADGRYHAYVSLGIDPITGRPSRRHIAAKDKKALVERVGELERARDQGEAVNSPKSPTVEQWLHHFLSVKANNSNISPSRFAKLEWAVRRWLIPNFGAQRLDKLTAEIIERGLRNLTAKDGTRATSKTADEVFPILRSALKMATDRGRLTRNPAALVEHRSPRTPEVDPLTADEIAKIVAACDTSTESARWLVGLALGLRQGEALGLQWGDIDFSSGCIRIRRQWLRKTYRHGCVELAGCKSAAACPCRVVNPRVGVLKSSAGRRDVFAPAELIAILKEHKAAQAAVRLRVGDCWNEGGWVFTSAAGTPLDHRGDLRAYKRMLARAGVRDTRLHDLRHTNATLMLLEGIDPRVVRELLGWSTDMTGRYQHVVEELRLDASRKIATRVFGRPSVYTC
jgi:integrase